MTKWLQKISPFSPQMLVEGDIFWEHLLPLDFILEKVNKQFQNEKEFDD